MDVPDGLRYSDDHEWLRSDGPDAVVGITRYAADELGDVVFVELPVVGRRLTAHEAFGVIESDKTASDLYCPVAGEVVAVNAALGSAPELINSDPYGDGWIVRLRLDDSDAGAALKDADAYRIHIGA
jgi:glycine cleavage system H protein